MASSQPAPADRQDRVAVNLHEEKVAAVARCLAAQSDQFVSAAQWRDGMRAHYENRARRILQTIANVEAGCHSGGLP